MVITPVTNAGNTVGSITGGPAVQPAIRSLKMSTNATPGRHEAQVEELPGKILSTGDPVDEATIEATKPLSPQFAALAKQKRALQQERQALDREKAALSQSSAQGDVVNLAQLKSDPLRTVLEAGVTWDQLTEAVLNHQSGPSADIQALKAEIKALKEGVDTKFTEKASQEEQQVLAEMRRDAQRLTAQGDDYEMVRETRSIPHVMQLIERTYRESGEVLDIREALQLVEDHLIKESLKVAGIKKVQSRLAPPPAPPQPQQRGMRTLSNRDTASVPLSAKARALAAFHGTLKR